MIPGDSERTVLRVLTCGSVDDGKSTLIGRLLYDCDLVPDDQLSALERDSRSHGTVAGGLDFALLLDGLQAEREQGITIDVAYRYFATKRRKFIVIDAPGHQQYTRNMVTGASQADVAVVLVDARKGILEQTRRHSQVLGLVGLKTVILAVNKMDLVGYDRDVFDRIVDVYRSIIEPIGLELGAAVPVAAVLGGNVVRRSDHTPWYEGPALLDVLEEATAAPAPMSESFRMPVQWVNRPDLTFRGFSGRIASGSIAPNDTVISLPSGRRSRIARIVTQNGDLPSAGRGRSVTLTLEDEIDVGRGSVLVADPAPSVGDRFVARLVWFGEAAMLPGRRYLMKLGTQMVTASITTLKHRIDIATMTSTPARELGMNDVGTCDVATEGPVVFEPYATNRELGAFILIDRMTEETVGAGMIQHELRRGSTVFWSHGEITREDRIRLKGHRPCVLWLTGLSGAGKSTIAHAIDRRLTASGCHVIVLDGDNLRHGLNSDLGFTDADRVENIRRAAEVAKLMTEAGLIVIAALISPFRSERMAARERMAADEFLEIFVDAPLAVCEARDPKGLYKRARAGTIPNFTGIGAPYEAPESPDLRLDSAASNVDDLAEIVVAELRRRAVLQ